jgi:N-acetylglutamate synthase-like GNAT family acetyltransferase
LATVLEEISAIEQIAPLVSDADADGHRFVKRMVAEWHDGTNRFASPGEHLYGVHCEGTIVAVGGLNVDPYLADSAVGRVRHVYVARSQRRSGVGSMLLHRIVEDAHGVFDLLRLRTYNPDAAAFYVARGFSEVREDEFCTHELQLGA